MKLVHASSHPLGTAEGTHIIRLYYDETQSVTRKQPGLCFLGGMGERYIWHPNLGCVRKTCVLRDYGIIVATDLDYGVPNISGDGQSRENVQRAVKGVKPSIPH